MGWRVELGLGSGMRKLYPMEVSGVQGKVLLPRLGTRTRATSVWIRESNDGEGSEDR